MFKAFRFFAIYVLFWLIYFAFFRVIFFFFTLSSLPLKKSISLLPPVLFHAIRIDLSATGYTILLPLLLYLANSFFHRFIFKRVLSGYVLVILSVFTTVLVANIFLYQSWGTLINSRAVGFIADPAEMFASLTLVELVGAILSIALVVLFFFKIFFGIMSGSFLQHTNSVFAKLFSFMMLVVLTTLMLRGGWQQIPINESSAYFSHDVRLNHIATNPVWFLGHNLKQAHETDKNSFTFYNQKEADSLVENLYNKSSSDNSISILNNTKPNIVFIMLESYTADFIKSLGGDEHTAPQFEKLVGDGLLFTNIYSSGFRTDQAFVSVLSGFPAQPDKSIIRYPEKTRFLPSLPSALKKQGYYSSFYYGGELGFSNLYSYLTNCGFDKVTGKNSFPPEQYNSKWGAHDEFVLSKQLSDLQDMKQPFFSVVMTLTSHEPYESPVATPFTGSDPASRFRGVAWYTDKCLGEYFVKAKKQTWYNNTLYVIVADHGHLLPKQRMYIDPASRHIPLLLTGGALKSEYRNKKITITGNQNDIAATLLKQLKINDASFVWSNDLLNARRKNFAYLCMDDAIGWVTDSGQFVYQMQQSKLVLKHPQDYTADTLSAKAYLQNLYKDFLRN